MGREKGPKISLPEIDLSERVNRRTVAVTIAVLALAAATGIGIPPACAAVDKAVNNWEQSIDNSFRNTQGQRH